MQKYSVGATVVLVAIIALPSITVVLGAQQAGGVGDDWPSLIAPGWLNCPRCVDGPVLNRAADQLENEPFNPRDLSGVWGQNGANLDRNAIPQMTAWGQARYDAAAPDVSPSGADISKDPMLICDPLGYPRWFTYNYGFEFIHLPDRTLQFFEFYHTYRTIWTDGRGLPVAEEVDPRWLGYSIGRWEGDTFVVESNGFTDRAFLMFGTGPGYPQSQQMRLTERYQRVNYSTLQVNMTIDDPMAYTGPWVTNATINLSPNTELWEYFCVPSDEALYRTEIRLPAAGAEEIR